MVLITRGESAVLVKGRGTEGVARDGRCISCRIVRDSDTNCCESVPRALDTGVGSVGAGLGRAAGPEGGLSMSAVNDRNDTFPVGIRRALAIVAASAIALAGWQITAGAHAGIGVIGMPGATADPTGPPGPGGPGGMNGGQFQPPGLPPQLPDYQGGINQPPLDQNNGISIYNTGTQGAPQQSGAPQSAQAQQEAQQPAHGTQMPDYQTAAPYTQGPGKANPDYQGPRQGSQQQQGQPSQQQQQPSQEPTQTQQPGQNDQQDNNCQFLEGSSAVSNGKIVYSTATQFGKQLAAAAKSWNDIGGIQIEPSGGSSSGGNQQSTLEIVDVDQPNLNWPGLWVPGGGASNRILLNTPKLKQLSPQDVQGVIAHELGHALGLGHSRTGQLMQGDWPGGPNTPQDLDAQLLRQISQNGLPQQCNGSSTPLEDPHRLLQGTYTVIDPYRATYDGSLMIGKWGETGSLGDIHIEWTIDGPQHRVTRATIRLYDATVNQGMVQAVLRNGSSKAPAGGSQLMAREPVDLGTVMQKNGPFPPDTLLKPDSLVGLQTHDLYQSFDHNVSVTFNLFVEGYQGMAYFQVRSPVLHTDNPGALIQDYRFTDATNLPQLAELAGWVGVSPYG